MKRNSLFISAFLTVCLIFSLCITAVGADNKIEVPELKLSLSLPDQFEVFTRQSSELELIVDTFGIDAESFSAYLTDNDIYIDAITEDYITEFLLVGSSNEDTQKIFDYNLLKEKEIEACKEPIKKAFAENGMEVSDISTYNGKNAKFFVIRYIDNDLESGQVVSGIRYSTIFNGMAINLTLHSSGGTMAEEKAAVIEKIVGSIEFTEILDIPEGSMRKEVDTYVIVESVALFCAIAGAIFCGIYIYAKKRKENLETKDKYETLGK